MCVRAETPKLLGSHAYMFIRCGYKFHASRYLLQHNHWIGTTIFATGSAIGGIKKTHDRSKHVYVAHFFPIQIADANGDNIMN